MLKATCALSFGLLAQVASTALAYDPIVIPEQAGTEANNKAFTQIEKREEDANRHLTWRDAVKEGDRRLGLQQIDLAEGCFRQAFNQIKKDKSATADDKAMVEARLAALLQTLGINDEAVPLFKKAISTLTKAYGKNSTKPIPYLLQYGGVAEADGDYKVAQKQFEQANRLAASADAYMQAKCLYALGHVNTKFEHIALAEQDYEKALLLLLTQKSLPEGNLLDHVIADYTDVLEKNTAHAKNLTASVNTELLRDRLDVLPQKQGVPPSRFEREVSSRLAKSTLDKIPEQELKLNDQAKETPSPEAALLGPKVPFDPVSAQGIDQQKISFYERMVAVDIKSLGPEHPSVARDLSGLSALYMAAGEYDQAKILLMRALKIYEKIYGTDSALTTRTRALLELVNENQATAASGAGSGNGFVADLPIMPLLAQKVDTAIRLNYLASLLYNDGQIAQASRIYAYAVADIYYSCGDQNLLMAAGLIDFARVLRSAGNAPRATLLEADARAIKVRVVAKQVARSVR